MQTGKVVWWRLFGGGCLVEVIRPRHPGQVANSSLGVDGAMITCNSNVHMRKHFLKGRPHTSVPNDRWVIATSSSTMPKSAALLIKLSRTCRGGGMDSARRLALPLSLASRVCMFIHEDSAAGSDARAPKSHVPLPDSPKSHAAVPDSPKSHGPEPGSLHG
eukprot:71809-Chlamydomonas_euryale.AAC.6